MNAALPMLTILVLSLAGCSDQGGGERAAGAGAPAPAVAAPTDQPGADVPPATAPPGSLAALPPTDSAPAAEGAIGYGGFGPARFGADDEAVRMAWGKDIKADTPSEPGGCYYLFPQPRPQASGYGIGFMIEGDRFSRIDVDSADIVAPGGGRVGMTAAEIRSRYAGRIEEQQHKYVEGGRYLRIKDSGGGSGVLLFVTDAAGKVTSWRVGVPPQVDYVEACS
jgi:hypothetical protein